MRHEQALQILKALQIEVTLHGMYFTSLDRAIELAGRGTKLDPSGYNAIMHKVYMDRPEFLVKIRERGHDLPDTYEPHGRWDYGPEDLTEGQWARREPEEARPGRLTF